ncbi:MAG: SDR family NAD(P)-dependent oxidoreductase, partial [Geminicoccaceae bacterium]
MPFVPRAPSYHDPAQRIKGGCRQPLADSRTVDSADRDRHDTGLFERYVFGDIATMNQIDLQGKRAVVTGGAQGIGRAIAERFLASGAKVSLWDRDQMLTDATCRELADAGETIGVQVDLTDLAAVEAARDRTNAALGGIDILVNNAGIAGPNAQLWEYPPDAWREVIDVDLNAVFY